MADTIAYLSQGAGRHQFEVAYSALTLRWLDRSHEGAYDTCIVTDTPAYFTRFGLKVLPVDGELMRQWKGRHGYVPRCKIKVAEMLFDRGAKRLMLVDGDTFFVRSPANLLARIRPGFSAMYEQECRLGDAAIPDYRIVGSLLESLPVALSDGTRTIGSPRSMQWNSGIIGLHKADARYIGEVLSVNDLLHEKHAFWAVEQTAFTLVLGLRTRIHAASQYLYHYNCDPRRLAFNADVARALDHMSGSPSASELKSLYELRLTIPLRYRAKRTLKRMMAGLGMWGRAMHLKQRLGEWTGGMGLEAKRTPSGR